MYRRALEVNPEDVLVMVRMAGALLAHGKADAAIAELKLACELECDVHGMAFNSLIKAYQYLGKAREISVLKLQQAGSETNSIKKRVFAFAQTV
jgi:lipopolysaccharide biosynthesis regulator YciM